MLELARRHPDSGVPRTAEGLREFYAFRDFPHFIEVYMAVRSLLTEPEDIADLVRGIARKLAAQNVRYAEIGDAPVALQHNGMPAAVVTAALDAGAREALSEHGVRIGYIFDFPGQDAERFAVPTLDHALTAPPEALIGLGIGGGRAPGGAGAAGDRCSLSTSRGAGRLGGGSGPGCSGRLGRLGAVRGGSGGLPSGIWVLSVGVYLLALM